MECQNLTIIIIDLDGIRKKKKIQVETFYKLSQWKFERVLAGHHLIIRLFSWYICLIEFQLRMFSKRNSISIFLFGLWLSYMS